MRTSPHYPMQMTASWMDHCCQNQLIYSGTEKLDSTQLSICHNQIAITHMLEHIYIYITCAYTHTEMSFTFDESSPKQSAKRAGLVP